MAGRAQTPSLKHREVFRRGLSDPSPSHSTVPSSPKVLIAPYYKTWPLFSVNQMKTPGIAAEYLQGATFCASEFILRVV